MQKELELRLGCGRSGRRREASSGVQSGSGVSPCCSCDVKYTVRIKERPKSGQDVRLDVEQSGQEPSQNHATRRRDAVIESPTLRHSFWVPFEAWDAVAKAGKSAQYSENHPNWWRAGLQWKDLVLPELRALNPHCRLRLRAVSLRFRAPHVGQWKLGSYACTRLVCDRPTEMVGADGKVETIACDVKYYVRIIELPEPGTRVRFDVEQTGGEPSFKHPPPMLIEAPLSSAPEEKSQTKSIPKVLPNSNLMLTPVVSDVESRSRSHSFTVPWGAWDEMTKSAKAIRLKNRREQRWRFAGRGWKDWVMPQIQAINPFCRVGLRSAALRFRSSGSEVRHHVAFAMARLLCERKRDLGSGETVLCDVKYAVRVWERPKEGEDVNFVLEQSGGIPSQNHPTPKVKERFFTGARKKALLLEFEQFPGSMREFVVGKRLEGVPVPSLPALRNTVRREKLKGSLKRSKTLEAKAGQSPADIDSESIEAASDDATSAAELLEMEQDEESLRDSDASFEAIENVSETENESFQATLIHGTNQEEPFSASSIAEELHFEDKLFAAKITQRQEAPLRDYCTSEAALMVKDDESDIGFTEALLSYDESNGGEDMETALSSLCSEDEIRSPTATTKLKQQDASSVEEIEAVLEYATSVKTKSQKKDSKEAPLKPGVTRLGAILAPETYLGQPAAEHLKKCALCSSAMPAAELETHLRLELGYCVFRCLVCPASFVDRAQAELHFRSSFAAHPGAPVSYAEHRDVAKERRLLQLLTESASV